MVDTKSKENIVMLKFQFYYTTMIQNFEDFILVVFVLIDDFYQTYVSTSRGFF
mgnify:CR=1 FL=1